MPSSATSSDDASRVTADVITSIRAAPAITTAAASTKTVVHSAM